MGEEQDDATGQGPDPRAFEVPLGQLRRERTLADLREGELAADPIEQFATWMKEALAAGGAEPNAMTVATATPDGVPSARIMLLKGVDKGGFTFFSNYDSRKGRELSANPHAALVFHWPALERQVRVTGQVQRVSAEESDAYFRTRPVGSRLGALASPQSEVISDRQELRRRLEQVQAEYGDQPPPRPQNWGGYRLRPETVEFWQGRPNRLHDRLRYRRVGDRWVIERLAP
ncbi:MAG TPA: pyridoxamine 5'-phosphate oxidase [Egibacteraceae bacterium]|nr:pyridoxamine 5'-phosphate oxidase [Egibacteraceae bacterium]